MTLFRLGWRIGCLALLALALVRTARGNTFTFPVEEGLQFYEQDTVNVSWTTDWNTKLTLWVFCSDGTNGAPDTKQIINNVPKLNGSELVTITYGTTFDHCWFNLRNETDTSFLGINSVGFALSADQRSQTTIGIQGTATTSFASTVKNTAAATTGATAGKNSDDGSSSGGLSTGAKAGIGVGAALGGLGVIALGVAFWTVRRRRARESGVGGAVGGGGGEEKKEIYGGPLNDRRDENHELLGSTPDHHGPMIEMEARPPPTELPT